MDNNLVCVNYLGSVYVHYCTQLDHCTLNYGTI